MPEWMQRAPALGETQRALLEAAVEGDQAAYGQLVDTHRLDVAFTRLGNPGHATQ